MNNHKILSAMLGGLCWLHAQGAPAYPWPQTVTQPDGAQITYILSGDEHGAYMRTLDGYLLTRNKEGMICYAETDSGHSLKALMPAHDIRTEKERDFIKKLPCFTHLETSMQPQYERLPAVATAGFRGLVILVNYSNRKFITPSPGEFYSRLVNAEDFSGYATTDGDYVEVTGSVRDYFRDNSGGQFTPEFDVYGPVNLDVPCEFPAQMQNAEELIRLAFQAADAEVDFSKYDSDGDGKIDMAYFIFAGNGSNYTGGKEIWPHKSELPGLELDGVGTWTYACSAELSGSAEHAEVDGIGTICHEFSHILGMVDEYDTDYGGSGGEADHPNTWSLMSMGCYLNHGRTPVGYSAYERIQAGFMSPDEISESGSYSLAAFESSGQALRINSIVGDEFFILENRQPVKWDKALPGHGMLVYRVDRTSPELWSTNRVNRDPNHPYYAFLSAKPQMEGVQKRRLDTDYDPFPGRGNVTELTNLTTPSLQSWYGYNSNVVLHDISEKDGIISFHAEYNGTSTRIESWKNLSIEEYDGAYKGEVANWTPAAGAQIDREHSKITFVKKSQLTSTPIAGKVSMVKFKIINPTSSTAIFQMKYSLNGGSSWTLAKSLSGNDRATIEKNSESTVSFNFDEIDPGIEADLQLRIVEFSGAVNDRCEISDLEFIMVQAWDESEKLMFLLPDGEYVDVENPLCPVMFFYDGESYVKEISYSWNCGQSHGEGNYIFETELDSEANSSAEGLLPLIGIEDLGRHELNLQITSVNGVSLSSPLEAVREAEIRVIPFVPVTRPLVEEYTGLNCHACPKGYVFMETMHRRHEDMFVGMAYHTESFENAVGMVTLHNEDFPVTPSFFPSGTVNRKEALKIEELESSWNRAAQEMAPANVEITLMADDAENGILHACASTVFIEDNFGEDYSLSIALIADNLKNELWKQNNGFSGIDSPKYTGDLWDIFTKGEDYVSGLVYNDVVIAYPDMDGIDDFFPSSIHVGECYSGSVDFDVTDIRNIFGQEFVNKDARFRAVVILTDMRTGLVVNCKSSEPFSRIENGIKNIETTGTMTVCMDITGRPVTADTPGVQIRVYRMPDGSYKSAKVMVTR